MAVAVCGDDAGDVSAGAGGVWGVGGGGEGCGGVSVKEWYLSAVKAV